MSSIVLPIALNVTAIGCLYLGSPNQKLLSLRQARRSSFRLGIMLLAMAVVAWAQSMHVTTALFVTVSLAMCQLGLLPWFVAIGPKRWRVRR